MKRDVNDFLNEVEAYDKDYLTKEEATVMHEKMKGLSLYHEDSLMADEGIGRDSKGYYRITSKLTDQKLNLLVGIRTYKRLGKVKNLMYILIGILVMYFWFSIFIQ